MIGGSGADWLIPGRGESLMIAGTTAFDSNENALFAIMQEWNSAPSRATRLADLSGTGQDTSFSHRLNGNFFLRSGGLNGTVVADQSRDVLFVRPGFDWYFADAGDTVGRMTEEIRWRPFPFRR